MAKKQRRNHGTSFKAKVALEAIKEEETLAALSERYQVNPTQISEWKKQLLDRAGDIFSKGSKPAEKPDIKALHSKIGQLTMENDDQYKAQIIDRTAKRIVGGLTLQCRVLQLMKKNVAIQIVDPFQSSGLNRFSQLNDFDQVDVDYGTTVNSQVQVPFPLLFFGHLFKESAYQKEKTLYPKLATFFFETLVGHKAFDIVRSAAVSFEFASELNRSLAWVKDTLQTGDLPEEQRVILARFKCRFIVAMASLSDDWSPVQNYFASFDSPQTDPELSWYENACIYRKFSAMSCIRLTKSDATHWIECINSLEPIYCKPAMLLGFLNVYTNKLSVFPDIDFLEKNFSETLSSLEIEGTFSQVANRVVKISLNNPIMKSVDTLSFGINHDDNVQKRLEIRFDEADLLGKTVPFYFDISNYGDRSSLVAFFAQYQLPQLCLAIGDQPNLSPQNNKIFRDTFFCGLEDRGWINSTGALVFPLDEGALKTFFIETLQSFFSISLPQHITECLQPQLDAGKRQYDQKLKLLSGFVQHDAIAIFIKGLHRDGRGVADENLHHTMTKSLKSCLQLRLKSIDISCLAEEHQDEAWDDLAQKVLEHLNGGNGVILPSGAPIDDENCPSAHAIYVAIRHVKAGKHVRVIVINGGEACTQYHSECVMQSGEMPYYHYKQSETLCLDDHRDALKSFIRTILSFPHTRGDWSELYDHPEIPLKNHPKTFPLQLMGSCAIHNLKYAVKAFFGFNEREMGDMMRSGMIGIDALSCAKGDVEDLDPRLLNQRYISVMPVHKKLNMEGKHYANLGNAMKDITFKAGIQSLIGRYKEDQVKYSANQLFSSAGNNFESSDRFFIELKYDLETKAEKGQPLTLQELYTTSYGWNQSPTEALPPQKLVLFRTMNKTDWEKLKDEDYTVLCGGHIGDFKQALRYLMGSSNEEKVMVEFTLKEGAEKQLFSKSLALPKKENRSTILKKIAKRIGGDSFPVCNTNEGTSSAIALKSESTGEAGFSIGIGGKKVSSIFEGLVESIKIIMLSARNPPYYRMEGERPKVKGNTKEV